MWSLDKLKENLEAISSHVDNMETAYKGIQEKFTEAGVLVPIVIQNGVPSVLLTVRSMNLSTFPGQVSFPGGKRDPWDNSLVATALRETKEEIGLSEDRLNVLGSILPFYAKGRILVKPVIAIVVDFESFHPKLNHSEVDEIIIVPLENFIKQECRECKLFSSNDKEYYVDVFLFSQNGIDHFIWGLTAYILTCVASLLFGRLPDFEYQESLFISGKNRHMRQIHKSFIKSRL